MTDMPDTNLTMLTLVKPEGELEVSLERRPMPTPKSHEVLGRKTKSTLQTDKILSSYAA